MKNPNRFKQVHILCFMIFQHGFRFSLINAWKKVNEKRERTFVTYLIAK